MSKVCRFSNIPWSKCAGAVPIKISSAEASTDSNSHKTTIYYLSGLWYARHAFNTQVDITDNAQKGLVKNAFNDCLTNASPEASQMRTTSLQDTSITTTVQAEAEIPSLNTEPQNSDLNALLEHPNVNALLQNPDLNALLANPDLNALLANPDVKALLEDSEVKALLEDPEVNAQLTKPTISLD